MVLDAKILNGLQELTGRRMIIKVSYNSELEKKCSNDGLFGTVGVKVIIDAT